MIEQSEAKKAKTPLKTRAAVGNAAVKMASGTKRRPPGRREDDADGVAPPPAKKPAKVTADAKNQQKKAPGAGTIEQKTPGAGAIEQKTPGAGATKPSLALKKPWTTKGGVNAQQLQQKKKKKMMMKGKLGAAADQKKDSEKPKWFEMKRKDRKKMRQQQDNKFYQLQLDAKKLWEKLRRADVRSEEKHKVAADLHQLIRGNIVNIIEAHDTSRVVECLYANGSHEIKNEIFAEVQEKIVHYAKCKYAKNVIMAFVRHGSQAHKAAIYRAVQTRVADLFLHKEAANIISALYDDHCNTKMRAEMAQEFYSRELVYFKSEDATTFKAAYDLCTEKTTKQNMLSEFKEKLLKLTDKGVIKYGLYHLLLFQLFEVLTDKTERLEMIRQIQHILVEILHTKEGMQVALQCIWYSTAKERKAIAKSLKAFVTKIATDDQGHKVLLGLFDVVDDTVMLNQSVISELMKNRYNLLKDKFGSKVLVYLMVGRDPHVIAPDTIELLKQGDTNENSKKAPELRRNELRKLVQQPLIESICEHLEELVADGETSVVVRDIILAADEEFRLQGMGKVVDLLKVPYEKTAENHLVESKQGHFFLKKLLLSDKEKDAAEFSRLLKDRIGEDVIRSWWRCNRGAFLCVTLMELRDVEVQQWAKNILAMDKAEISQEKNNKGAEILLQKL